MGSVIAFKAALVTVRMTVAQTTANTLAEEDVFTIPQTGSGPIHPHHLPAGTADSCRVKPDQPV